MRSAENKKAWHWIIELAEINTASAFYNVIEDYQFLTSIDFCFTLLYAESSIFRKSYTCIKPNDLFWCG